MHRVSFNYLKMICILLSLKINYFLHRFVLFSMLKIYFFLFSHSSTEICQLRLQAIKDIYIICRPGGPYWEKLCRRSWVRPEAAGRGPYSRSRAQFFPIRTDLGRQITCLFFCSVEYFVSSFCVEFSLQAFSNLVYACVWHLGNRKSNQHYTYFLVIIHILRSLQWEKSAGKDAKARKLVAVRTRGPYGKIRTAGARAISQSDSRI